MTRHRLTALGLGGVGVLALVLVLVASQRSSDATEDSGARVAPVRLTSLDGRRISLPSGRPGMVMFSGTSCVTDVPAARSMAEYASRARGRVDAAYISVDPGETRRTLADRRDAIGGATYPFAIDTGGTLAAQNRITALGTVLVYDAQGTIVARFLEPGKDELRAALQRAGVA